MQSVLSGKNIEKSHRHFFLFRKLAHCSSCGATLIGETQKGHNYYRCHTKGCAQKTIREDALETALIEVLKQLRFNEVENRYIREQIKESYQNVITFKETQTKALNLQLEQLQARLSKLADAYIDAMLDKTTYLEKKNSLILEQEAMKESLKKLDAGGQEVLKRVEAFIELLNNAYLSYKLANQEERRDLVKMIISNLTVEGKNLTIKLNYPFQIVADRQKSTNGSPQRISYRTLSAILRQLFAHFQNHTFFPESEEDKENKVKLPLDRAILIEARKITSQSLRLFPN